MGGTGAFFNDEETSTGNVFAAGELDLQVDSVAHINGLICFDGRWLPESTVEWNEVNEELETTGADIPTAIEEYNEEFPANVPQAGDNCVGTWTLTDLGPENTFFAFQDLKPGDTGENTISLHVFDNDAYMCAAIHDVANTENDCNEPELGAEVDAYGAGNETCGDPGEGEGELAEELTFFVWEDDGDNVYEPNGDDADGVVLVDGADGEGIEGVYPLYTPGTGVFAGGDTQYLGVAWCYGTFNPDGSCNGAPVTNISQGDKLEANMTFYVEQARNNDRFECPPLEDFEGVDPQRQVVGAVLGDYETPSCSVTVTGGQSIQEAVDTAADNSTVCVDSSYDMTGDNTAIRIETLGLTLAATVRGVDLDVPVVLSNSNVTVTGFDGTIGQAESPAEQAAFYLDNDADNFEISFNTVTGGTGAAILTETGAALGGGLISNNKLSGATQGIYINPHTGVFTVEYNDIDDNVAGIAGLMGVTVRYNEFEHTLVASEAIGVDSSHDANPATVILNNFLDDTRLNTYGPIAGDVNAINNYWGPNGGANQTGGSEEVIFTPEEVSAFPHNS